MAIENERKIVLFGLKEEHFDDEWTRLDVTQGYLRSNRIRRAVYSTGAERYWFTAKHVFEDEVYEYEMEMPRAEFEKLITIADNIVVKTRFTKKFGANENSVLHVLVSADDRDLNFDHPVFDWKKATERAWDAFLISITADDHSFQVRQGIPFGSIWEADLDDDAVGLTRIGVFGFGPYGKATGGDGVSRRVYRLLSGLLFGSFVCRRCF